ncbi:hypothetical protein FQA39_LY14685 [Lamprigera yunnana]|nr:hypothetical protein FQA39_LY14685 [Lamprigera yunnana]
MLPLCMCLDEVNKLPSEQFIKIFGNVVEHTPAAAICILKNRPFDHIDDIFNAINVYLNSLPEHEIIKILQLHPDLAGKLADYGKLSIESTLEQTSVGLHNLSVEDKHKFTSLNEEYKTRFDIPFIICVGETNGIQTIMQAIEQRLCNYKKDEITTAVDEIKKISRLRILALVK